MSQTSECFICGFKSQKSFRSLKNFKQNQGKSDLIPVKDSPQTNFILNEVLEFPSRELRRLPKTQKKGVRPNNLARSTPRILNLCHACHWDVESIKRIYEELQEVTRRFNAAKGRIQEIMETKSRSTTAGTGTADQRNKLTVTRETEDDASNSSMDDDNLGPVSSTPAKRKVTPATVLRGPQCKVKITRLRTPEQSNNEVIVKQEEGIEAEDGDVKNSNDSRATKPQLQSDDDDEDLFASSADPDPDFSPDQGPSSVSTSGSESDDYDPESDFDPGKPSSSTTHPFRCSLCPRNVFSTEASLKFHRRQKHNLDMFKCDKCDEDFASRKSLKEHKLDVHNFHNSEVFVCPHCPSSTPKTFRHESKLQQHISVVHEGKHRHSCEVCGKGFHERIRLKKHLFRLHGIGQFKQKLFPCPIEGCSKVLTRSNSFKAHVARHEGKIEPIQCEHCPKKFFSRDCFHRHQIQEHNVQPTGASGRNWPKCEICGKIYTNKESLEKHVPVCRKDKVPKCRVCGVMFDKYGDLRTHLKFKHPEVEPEMPTEKNDDKGKKSFQCAECGKTFTVEKSLQNHVDVIHRKQSEFNCDICGARKWNKLGLDMHMYQEHGIGEPRYQCESCGKTFWQLFKKKRHVCNGTLPPEGVLKMSVCEICGKEFKARANMKRHMMGVHKVEMD